jgi:predicted hydrocarbon binding protein
VHGLIFSSLRDFLTAEHGAALAHRVLAGEPAYLLSESYPDESFGRLVERATEILGADADELVHDFGVYTGSTTFTRLYPAFFAISDSTREFLLTVETRIHELVRATIPNAAPPQLHVTALGDDGVTIAYSSPRHLCTLLRGLTEGTALHYGERTTIDELTCMRRGDERCTFEVRFSAM